MNRSYGRTGALLGGLTSVPLIVVAYWGQQLANLPFVPFDLFDLVIRVLPGPLVTWVIDSMVALLLRLGISAVDSAGQTVEHALALVQFVLLAALGGAIVGLAGRRLSPRRLPTLGFSLGLLMLALFVVVEALLGIPSDPGPLPTILWLGGLFLGWGVLFGWLLREAVLPPGEETGPNFSRRRFLVLTGAAVVALAASATALGRILLRRRPGEGGPTLPPADAETSGPAASPPSETLAARLPPAPGTRPEVTPNQDFFRLDIVSTPPQIDAETWRLEIDGLVEQPLSLSLAEIRARPAAAQYITLACISNPIGGSLIDTALWRGVPLVRLLEEAQLRPEAVEIAIEAADGFYESVSLADARDERTLLVYEMNGVPLSPEHGFPLRIYIPNRYGMKQPKWITHLQVIGEERSGYWVERGWSEEAIVLTISLIDDEVHELADPSAPAIPLGGVAYAGARGISRVEVRVDDGPWEEAELRLPPLSPLTWVQWRFLWPSQPGRHVARVRAYDGTGQVQESRDSFPHPSGATGLDTTVFTVEA